MIIEQIITNINQLDPNNLKNYHIEKVYLESADLIKRVQRVTSDHGREFGIRLKEARDLLAGDVLFMDEHNIIVIDVIPDDLLVITPSSLEQMGDIAHKIGNRHLPAQFEGNEMLVMYDYLVEQLLQESKVPYTREKKKVRQAFRHIGH